MATKPPPRIPVPEVTYFDPLPNTQSLRTPRYQAQGAPAQSFAPKNPNVTPERLESLRAARAAPAPASAPASAPPEPQIRNPNISQERLDSLRRARAAPAPGPAAPAAPSTAPAAAQPPTTLRQRSYDLGKSAGRRFAQKPVGPVGRAGLLAGTAIMSAADSFGRDTEDYYRRLGMDTGDRSLLRDLGARSVGVVSDLGAAILDAPTDTVNAVRQAAAPGSEPVEMPWGSFTERLRRNDRPAEPAPTVAPANSGIRTQNVVEGLNTRGMTPGMPGPGRVLRDNFDPELAKLPAELPGGLRQGVVHRTLDANGRPVYSGSNVGVNPQFVDGAGKTVTPGGFMGEVPGMSPSLRTAMAGSGGPVARVEPGVQGGGVAGFGPTQAERDLANRRRSAEFYADSRDRRTRERGQRELDALDRAALAQGANETSLRNASAQADAARYGADRRLEGDMLQAEATTQAASLRGRQASMVAQMERQAQTLAMQIANGDRRAAARILDSMGFSGAKLLSSEASEQGLQIKNREDSEALLKSLSVGEDGKIDAARLARNQAVANDITGGQWSTMTPEERAKRQDDVRRGIQLLEGLNQYRDSTWAKRVGWDDTVEEFSSLPDVKGATITRLGAVEGAGTARAGKGDWKIRTQKGEVLYVPSSAVDQATLDMLKEMGAKIDTKD